MKAPPQKPARAANVFKQAVNEFEYDQKCADHKAEEEKLKKEEAEKKRLEAQKKYKAESSIGKMGAVYLVFDLHTNGSLDELIVQSR
jgi:hypothetical protein